eukprot:1156209-Pelagomonas_calceolata.AAC.5
MDSENCCAAPPTWQQDRLELLDAFQGNLKECLQQCRAWQRNHTSVMCDISVTLSDVTLNTVVVSPVILSVWEAVQSSFARECMRACMRACVRVCVCVTNSARDAIIPYNDCKRNQQTFAQQQHGLIGTHVDISHASVQQQIHS